MVGSPYSRFNRKASAYSAHETILTGTEAVQYRREIELCPTGVKKGRSLGVFLSHVITQLSQWTFYQAVSTPDTASHDGGSPGN